MSKLIFKLSSTALGYASCSKRLTLHTVQGYREPLMPARVVYGIAVHKFIDSMYKSGGNAGLSASRAKKAFELPKVDVAQSPWLSESKHMMTTCLNVWTDFIQEDSTFEVLQVGGVPLTEQTFEIPFYEDESIIVYLAGTLDKIGQFKGGCFAIGDWKTTSSWDNKGYFTQFEMSRQLRFYMLAIKLAGEQAPDSVLGKMASQKMGVFIDGIFLKQNPNEGSVTRSAVWQYTLKELEDYEYDLRELCNDLSYRVRHGILMHKYGLVNGSCEGRWGRCAFWNVCKSNEEVGNLLLKRDFNVVPWNPSDYNNLNDEV